MLQIAIVGIGAMGSLFAARLTPHARVTMLGHWPEQLAALQNGLMLIQPDGEERRVRVRAVADATKMPQADIALVLVKSYQSDGAAREIGRFLAAGGLALSLQNGLGNEESLAAVLGAKRVALGSTTEGATLRAPGVVRHAGKGKTIVTARQGQRAQLMSEFVHLLRSAGFQTETTPDVHQILWEKLAVNAAINPLTALLELPNGALLAHDATRTIMSQIATEAAKVATAAGYAISAGAAMARAMEVARLTAHNHSSMLQDVLNRRRTEIDAISGAIIQRGAALGVATPLNSAIYQLLSAKLRGENWRAHIERLPAAQQPLFTSLLSIQDRSDADRPHN